MYGNASLSLYNVDKRSVDNQLFYNVNNFPLGDVFQSMTIIGNRGYMVVNNSGKVVVIDIDTYKYLGTIKGLTSPRYIVPLGSSKIYISDLYSSSIAIADPESLQLTGSVNIGRSTEQLVALGEYVYTCSWSFSNKVYKIDTRTDRVVDSLEVGKQPNSIVADCNGKLWVLSDGGYVGSPYGEEPASLVKLDPQSFTIEQRIDFPEISYSPSELTTSSGADTLYYISGGGGPLLGGLYRMPVTATSLPSEPFIAQGSRLFYGVGIDPRTCEIYLSDAVDYVQQGTILRYTAQGRVVDQFKVDIIPSAFCFTSR